MPSSHSIPSQITDNTEFKRIDPALIKVEMGGLWRNVHKQDLQALKASIAWRERRIKGSGLLMPLLVSKIDGVDFYKLEDGARRLAAVRALIEEGFPISTVLVRVLPAPLGLSERLMLLENSGQPLDALEESRIIGQLEKQGLSFSAMAQILGISEAELRRRVKAPAGRVLPKNPLVALLPSSNSLSKGSLAAGVNRATSWVPKILDPTLHYIALEGLYEWMGASQAVKRGYPKKVVEMIEMMLKYCGGKMNLIETAEKLKKFKF